MIDCFVDKISSGQISHCRVAGVTFIMRKVINQSTFKTEPLFIFPYLQLAQTNFSFQFPDIRKRKISSQCALTQEYSH